MEYGKGRTFMLRVPEDEELVSFINKFAEEKGIKTGVFKAIGSLKNAILGYFNIELGRYQEIEINEVHELLLASGNISLKDGKPFAHVHVILGDHKGNAKGGHLVRGKVFVTELYVEELVGEPLERVPHGNLTLWRIE